MTTPCIDCGGDMDGDLMAPIADRCDTCLERYIERLETLRAAAKEVVHELHEVILLRPVKEHMCVRWVNTLTIALAPLDRQEDTIYVGLSVDRFRKQAALGKREEGDEE